MNTCKITVGTLKHPHLTIKGWTNKNYWVWHIQNGKCLYKSGCFSKEDAEKTRNKWLEAQE